MEVIIVAQQRESCHYRALIDTKCRSPTDDLKAAHTIHFDLGDTKDMYEINTWKAATHGVSCRRRR